MALKYWGKTISDYSAMRGPCPEGFHVPLSSEWDSILSVYSALWTSSNVITDLKISMPNDFISSSDGGRWISGESRYHCSNYWKNLVCTKGRARTSISWEPCFWIIIRAFKDVPAIPDSSWDTIYDWSSIASGAGIFWNQTMWLISISSDWNNWFTIQDKNLWATNIWDAWYYYQWWNCNGFTMGWVSQTSSTQVDASWYWPWNYYSSYTFVTNSNWDSSNNRNLRWWVTWIQQKPVDIVERYYWGKLVDDYSAMRWPCPEGFHVPSRNEWENVTWILFTTFGLPSGDSTTVNIYLKMPNAGSRSWSTISFRNTAGYYWTCSSSSSFVYRVRSFKSWQPSSSTAIQGLRIKATAVSIRWFKDVPVIPDNTWTVLYNWSSIAAWAWIFHSASLWLISISWDWQTWITMSDKNLWATTVRNNWDTLTAANSWWHFQWWNNYMFPFDWTVETSSTQIDTSAYWPGNYYSSNVFIYGNSDNDWSSPSNSNLRWWVTWVQQKPIKVTEVYYNTTKIRPLI